MSLSVPSVWQRLQTAFYAGWQAFNNKGPTDAPKVEGVGFTLADEDQERIELYRLFWKYYRGHHKKHLKVRMTPSGPGPDDNVTINLSRRIVDKGVSFLFGKPLEWQLSEGDQTPEEEALDRIWGNDQRRQAFFAKLGINGGVCGDFYLQVVPPTQFNDIPRVVNINPAIVFPKTDPNDIDFEWAFELRYFRGKTLARTIHAISDSGASWETWQEELHQGRWVAIGEPSLWPFEWPMFVHGQNLPNPNSYFGVSDLADADLNDAINMAASNINRITRIFAHPIVWGRQIGRDAVNLDNSQMILSPNPDAMMGALQLGNNLQSSQDYLASLRSAFAEITGVPQSDPERLKIGAESGFALKVLFNDLVLKTGLKRSTYGDVITEANRRLLALAGYGEENITKLHWQDPLPVDERAETESDKFELDNKLASKETIATERGRDWEAEQKRMQAEKVSNGNVGAELLKAFERGATTGGTTQ